MITAVVMMGKIRVSVLPPIFSVLPPIYRYGYIIPRSHMPVDVRHGIGGFDGVIHQTTPIEQNRAEHTAHNLTARRPLFDLEFSFLYSIGLREQDANFWMDLAVGEGGADFPRSRRQEW